jgi:uncharacterized protein
MSDLSWHDGSWLNRPASVHIGKQLVVGSESGSDFWQGTYYDFHRDSGHALLFPIRQGQAMEVTFIADFGQLYDQAGVLVRGGARAWCKAGLEVVDHVPHIGAVATAPISDWSAAPAPEWAGATVTVRASWQRDALIIRCRTPDTAWRFLRLVPFAMDDALAGPYCASPEHAGLEVRFLSARTTPADASLHDPPAS